jgi:hypothetical protein
LGKAVLNFRVHDQGAPPLRGGRAIRSNKNPRGFLFRSYPLRGREMASMPFEAVPKQSFGTAFHKMNKKNRKNPKRDLSMSIF